MTDIFRIKTISQLNEIMGQEKAKHPLVSVIDFENFEGNENDLGAISTSFYSVMLKNGCNAKLRYGREYYDFEEGTLVCIAPEQVIEMEAKEETTNEYSGWGLFFHPDLLRQTHLAERMKEFSFFSYDTHEALHLSDKEKKALDSCIQNIVEELEQNIDKHSQMVIVSNIELLLNYCSRFYDRQFITRKSSHHNILGRFEELISHYINSDQLKNKGIPSVKHLGTELHLSPNYLSDLLKRETGKNAQEHIHYYLIEKAKNTLLSSTNSVSEIAYELGFEYPQYFSKMFKKKTGMTPNAYRKIN